MCQCIKGVATAYAFVNTQVPDMNKYVASESAVEVSS
jgi:hypothetical protein